MTDHTPPDTPVFAPLSGRVLPLEAVPDPVFAGKMLGDGLAIEPVEGKVVSPIAGTVAMIFPTGHALALKTETELEILVHIGIDTVKLKGQGFTLHVREGQPVTTGLTLVTFDLELVRRHAPSAVTPVVVTGNPYMGAIIPTAAREVKAGRDLLYTIRR